MCFIAPGGHARVVIRGRVSGFDPATSPINQPNASCVMLWYQPRA